MLGQPGVVHAGKLSWLDDLVQEVILEAKAGGKGLVRGGDGARTEIRGAGRLFVTTRPTRPSSSSSGAPTSWPGPAGESSSPPRPCSRPGFRDCSSKTRKRFASSRHSNRPRNGWSSSWARRPRSWRAGIPTKPRPWCAGSGPKA